MKKILVLFLIAFLSLLYLGCPNAHCRVEGFGKVYLTILDETGKPFPDSEAKRFIIRCNSSHSTNSNTVINERDELIFSLGSIRMEYNDCKRLKKKEGFTDGEIINALTDSMCFSIKDLKEPAVYKTIVNKSYKSSFVKFERTNVRPATYISSEKPTHIYYCEVKLEKK